MIFAHVVGESFGIFTPLYTVTPASILGFILGWVIFHKIRNR